MTLGAPANLGATPIIPETPNNVNPQDLVAQINKVSNLVYAAFGPVQPRTAPGIHSNPGRAGRGPQAAPIIGPPGFSGYSLNVVGANRQPVQISQIYSAGVTYPIAGSTTTIPFNPKSGKSVPFYGSLSHGLDKQSSFPLLQSKDLTSFIPRSTVPAGSNSRSLWRQRARRPHRHAVQLRLPGVGCDTSGRHGQPDARYDHEGR